MSDVPGRVLLADDERTFAMTTARVLERHGISCDWVLSSDEASRAMSVNDYDVLIVDIKMPGNDDLQFLESIRQRDPGPAVILVTGYPSVDTAVRSIELGAFAYLIKPFEIGDFIETARKAVQTMGLRRKLVDHSASTEQLQQRLAVLRRELELKGAQSLDQTASEYLNLLLLGTGETVMEAMDVLGMMQCDDKDRPLRELSGHPERDMLRNAVDETVEVLERTKKSFKSKELATLRKRLERLLELTDDRQGDTRPPIS